MEGTQIFQIFSNTPHFCVSCVHLVSAPHSHLTWGVWGAFYKTPHFWGVGKVTHFCVVICHIVAFYYVFDESTTLLCRYRLI